MRVPMRNGNAANRKLRRLCILEGLALARTSRAQLA